MTIARYLARRCGLAGSTDLEAAQADEAVDAVSDWIQQQKEAIKPPLPGQKPVMPREFVDVQLQAWLAKMERLLEFRYFHRIVSKCIKINWCFIKVLFLYFYILKGLLV